MTNSKIAILIPSLQIGGVQRWALNISRELASRGYETHLVLVNALGPFVELVDPQVRLVNLGASRALAVLPRLIRYLNQDQPSVLVSAQTHINIIALWAAALSKCRPRVIVSERHHLSAAKVSARLGDRIAIWLARYFYPRSFAVVAVSHGVAHDLSRYAGIPREHIVVVYNPVVPPPTASDTLPLLPWPDRDQYELVLAVGRLEVQKDFGTLLSAFNLIRKQRNVRLLILGNGSCREQLEQQIVEMGLEATVSLPGIAEDPFPYFRVAHLFVLSSRWEGFPNVLAEALVSGVSIVSTDCPAGPSELLGGGKFGFLVPVGDSQRMADAMLQALQNPLDRDVLSKRAEDFSIKRSVDEYVALFEQ